jgi:tetratricopeptide (TPR) repeat protein
MTGTGPNSASCERATLLLEQEEYAGVLRVLHDAQEQLCDNGHAWQLRGLAHFALGDYERAVDALEHASMLIPLTTLAQTRLAACYLHVRRPQVAAVIYRHLAQVEMLAEELVECIADGLIRVRDYQSALQFCLEHLRQFRGNHRLLMSTAEVTRRLGFGSDEVLPFAYQAHRLQPENVSYLILFAQLLVDAGRVREAGNALATIELDRLQCVASLQRLRLLFQRMDDDAGKEHCQARLKQIGYELSSGYRPTKDE